MINASFTEGESHPSNFRGRREALRLTVAELAALARISVKQLESLEDTPPNWGQYDAAAAFQVEHALQNADRDI